MRITLLSVAGALLLLPGGAAAQAVDGDSVAAPALDYRYLPREVRKTCPMPVLGEAGRQSVAMPSIQPRSDVHYHIMILRSGCVNPLAGDSAPRPRVFTFKTPPAKLQTFPDSAMRTLFPDTVPTFQRRR